MKEYLLSRISYSPLTLLRALNVVAIAIIFVLSIIYNYDHIKKSDNYLFSYVIRAIPEMPKSVPAEKVKEIKMYHAVKNIDLGSSNTGQEDYDRAISQYADKNFTAAVASLNKAAADRSVTEKAISTKLELQRFKTLWDKVSKDKGGGIPADRRALMINRMIKYDKNISGGRLESEILLLKHVQ